MLLKNTPPEQTRNQIESTFREFYAELSPEQQAQVSFNQVFTDVHQTVRQTRALTLGLDDIPPRTRVPRDGLDCGMAIAMCVVDGVMLVLQAIGLPGAVAEKSAARVVNEATPLIRGSIRTYRILVQAVQRAVTNLEKARAYYRIFVTFIRAFGIRQLFKIIRNTMHWYDWLILGIAIVAQVLLLIATDGAAIILEIVLFIVSAVGLAVAIINAINACGKTTRGAPEDAHLQNPGFVLMPGETLAETKRLESINGAAFTLLQTDGNLVTYNINGSANWAASSNGRPARRLVMQEDGNCKLFAEGQPDSIWSTETTGQGNYLTLTNDGKLQVINSHNGNILWSGPE